MKRILFVVLLTLPGQPFAQGARVDTAAIMILDRMSDVIGELGSCSFRLSTSQDVKDDSELGMIKNLGEHEIYMRGPNKMLVISRGDKGHRGYWYNGSKLAYYSYNENNYAIIDAPAEIIATVEAVNKAYGIDFPAADFFYPSFTDDLIEHSDRVSYRGMSHVNGKACFRVIAKNMEMSVQLWIADDAWVLPAKMVIVSNTGSGTEQYEATFSDWQINPVLPDAMFEFTPPPLARKIKIMAK